MQWGKALHVCGDRKLSPRTIDGLGFLASHYPLAPAVNDAEALIRSTSTPAPHGRKERSATIQIDSPPMSEPRRMEIRSQCTPVAT